jgi:hypothetical protein
LHGSFWKATGILAPRFRDKSSRKDEAVARGAESTMIVVILKARKSPDLFGPGFLPYLQVGQIAPAC